MIGVICQTKRSIGAATNRLHAAAERDHGDWGSEAFLAALDDCPHEVSLEVFGGAELHAI
jgi:hypothetical protein